MSFPDYEAFWSARYRDAGDDYLFGTAPNKFLASQTALQVTGGQKPEKLPYFGQKNPLGRPGQPVEMAGAYVYLASEESSYTTGNTLSVTGGAPRAAASSSRAKAARASPGGCE